MHTQDTLNVIWNNSGEIHYDKRFLTHFIPSINETLLTNDLIGGKMLDLGCGSGKKANVFHKIGFDVTGLDHDAEIIVKATEDFPAISFLHYHFIDRLPFEDNTFDCVFSCSVMQYMDHHAIIEECKRILRPWGCIILIENLKNNPITRAVRTYLKWRKFNYQSFPYNHFTFREITRLKKEFADSSVHFCHVLTPLCHLRIAKRGFIQIERVDRLLLRVSFFKQFSWLAFFSGVNKK